MDVYQEINRMKNIAKSLINIILITSMIRTRKDNIIKLQSRSMNKEMEERMMERVSDQLISCVGGVVTGGTRIEEVKEAEQIDGAQNAQAKHEICALYLANPETTSTAKMSIANSTKCSRNNKIINIYNFFIIM